MERIPITVSSGLQPAAQNVVARLAAYSGLVLIDANPLAVKAGSLRTANLVMVGALSTFVPFDEEHWQTAMRERIPAKLLDVNLRAFDIGRNAVR